MSDMRKDHHPTQPIERSSGGVRPIPSDDETAPYVLTRAQIMERRSFEEILEDEVHDKLTRQQIAILAHYVDRGDYVEAGRFLAELMKPMIDKTVAYLREDV